MLLRYGSVTSGICEFSDAIRSNFNYIYENRTRKARKGAKGVRKACERQANGVRKACGRCVTGAKGGAEAPFSDFCNFLLAGQNQLKIGLWQDFIS